MSLGQRIRSLRVAAGLTQRQMAERIGVCTSTVTQWEIGMSVPRVKRLDAIAEALGVAPGELVDDPTKGDAAGPFVSATVPLVTPSNRGGESRLGDSVEVPASLLRRHPSAWATPVVGDAMDRVLPPGFVVVCDPDLVPANGSIVVASVDGGEPVMRRWYRGGNTVMLVGESHAAYEDVVRPDDGSVRVIGTVVWAQCAEPLA